MPSDILNNYFEENNKIDSMYRSVASLNGVPYIELTKHFISLSDKENYFFLFDLQICEYIYYDKYNDKIKCVEYFSRVFQRNPAAELP